MATGGKRRESTEKKKKRRTGAENEKNQSRGRRRKKTHSKIKELCGGWGKEKEPEREEPRMPKEPKGAEGRGEIRMDIERDKRRCYQGKKATREKKKKNLGQGTKGLPVARHRRTENTVLTRKKRPRHVARSPPAPGILKVEKIQGARATPSEKIRGEKRPINQ